MNAEELSKLNWEPDPLVFIFNNEIPGKTKMHTKTLDMERDWIKIDKTYPAQLELRKQLENERFEKVFVSTNEERVKLAKQELLEEICAYLPIRFPELFEKRNNHNSAYSSVYNRVSGELISTSPDDPMDPLVRASHLTQEDWCVMMWNEAEEAYCLEAGIVCFPMRWSLQEKYQKPLGSIHGPVKPFMKHLFTKVSSLFVKMKPSAPIWRGNWAIFNDLEGPLDLHTPLGHEGRNQENEVIGYQGNDTGRNLVFRAEYQTLRKLPVSGAIIFSIRTYQRYLEEFKEFPSSDCLGLVKAIETIDPEFYIYKGVEFWKEAAIKYLKDIVKDRENQKKVVQKKEEKDPVSTYGSTALIVAAVAVGLGLMVAFKRNSLASLA